MVYRQIPQSSISELLGKALNGESLLPIPRVEPPGVTILSGVLIGQRRAALRERLAVELFEQDYNPDMSAADTAKQCVAAADALVDALYPKSEPKPEASPNQQPASAEASGISPGIAQAAAEIRHLAGFLSRCGFANACNDLFAIAARLDPKGGPS